MDAPSKAPPRRFAAFLDLAGRRAVVVGGGPVAARRCEALVACGAEVRVVAPTLCARLEALRAAGTVRHEARRYRAGDLAGADLALAATDERAVNAAIAAEAKAGRVLVNVADDSALSTFDVPMVVERLPVQVAISSGGTSPVIARRLRTWVEAVIPAAFGRVAALAGRFRDASRRRFPDPPARARFWDAILDGPVARLALAGREAEAARALALALADPGHTGERRGLVSLVGCGPGHPDLLTLRALQAMQRADVVLHDHLVPAPIVALAARGAQRIGVGKERDNHTLPQGEINALMVRLAREGRRVVRLKGGDPFLFGRGGEEAEELAAHGVEFEVIPGVTAATGAGVCAGIPLTHRDCAHACVFVTGHLKSGEALLDWHALVRPNQTVAVYMGLHGLAPICAGLVAHGLPAGWPAALVERGSLPEQRVIEGTLDSLPAMALRERVRSPALLIVGEVVRHRVRSLSAVAADASYLTSPEASQSCSGPSGSTVFSVAEIDGLPP